MLEILIFYQGYVWPNLEIPSTSRPSFIGLLYLDPKKDEIVVTCHLVDIVGVDIAGVDIVGVDTPFDIISPTHNLIYNCFLPYSILIFLMA